MARIHTFVTTTDPATHKSKLHSSREGKWTPIAEKQIAMSTFYTHPFNVSLADEADLRDSDELVRAGTLGLSRDDGAICSYCDFAPGSATPMHQTPSADVGIVIEGSIELLLEDGSVTLARRGDTVVQRGTQHAWRNPSEDKWARMIFVLSAAKPVPSDVKEGEAGAPE